VVSAQVKKKVIMVIAPVNFRDEELFHTMNVLTSCGADVEVVSTRKGIAKGMLGGTFEVKKTIYDADWDKASAVVLVGGSGATVFWKNGYLLNKLKEAYKEGKIIAAICISPVALAKAGILAGRKATCWAGVRGQLMMYGARYTGSDVEVSGRVVTAAGPWAADEFGRAICSLLGYR